MVWNNDKFIALMQIMIEEHEAYKTSKKYCKTSEFYQKIANKLNSQCETNATGPNIQNAIKNLGTDYREVRKYSK